MTDMSSLCNLILIERMESIYLPRQIEAFAISILCTVFWYTVVGCMVDTIMLISDQLSLINGLNLMMNG
nr:hypothetical protein Iba_chr05aCG13750 [Ipomoea batatas]GMC96085.1 hypothetical protein Iba_chr05cCG14720 [Ipomoea batatas]GMD01940.1 hypothetical protein Iba_chr05fCG11880 [Ipomoea batatas]GME11703.1 hypothetical protein Iba_scaffold12155CG0070 [Ipomoea batatas]